MNAIIQINKRGTMTLPKVLRRTLSVERGGMVVAETSAQGIILRPSVTFPIEIYTDERVAEFDAADAELGRRLKRKQK
jgi:bifunctional DNA-binding transcriptional regulator/antitoxin component of YhaV-PrlF toxin-antitoxin module